MSPEEFKQKFGFMPERKLIKKGIIMCPRCIGHKAEIHTKYGIMICRSCQVERDSKQLGTLGGFPEFVPQYIKDDRIKNLKSQIQSHRGGELSKEFVEHYPDKIKGMVESGVVTQREVEKARNLWTDLPNYHHLSKTQ